MNLGMVFAIFLMLGVHWAFWICGFTVFIKFEIIWALFFQIFFLAFMVGSLKDRPQRSRHPDMHILVWSLPETGTVWPTGWYVISEINLQDTLFLICSLFLWSGRSEGPHCENTQAPQGEACVESKWGCQPPHELAISKSYLGGGFRYLRLEHRFRPWAWAIQWKYAWIPDPQKLYEIISVILNWVSVSLLMQL